jgi:uncharacterized protein (DUF2342 family)
VSPVRWPTAIRIADRVAGSYPLESTYHHALFARQAPELVARAAALVEEETRLRSTGTPDVRVVSRTEWIENNVAVFSKLLAPAEQRLEERGGFGRALGERVVAAELGALLGVLSKRVLGQYEMVLPTGEADAGDVMMFVGGNIWWRRWWRPPCPSRAGWPASPRRCARQPHPVSPSSAKPGSWGCSPPRSSATSSIRSRP